MSTPEVVNAVIEFVAAKHGLTPEDLAARLNPDGSAFIYDSDCIDLGDGKVEIGNVEMEFKDVLVRPKNWYQRAKGL